MNWLLTGHKQRRYDLHISSCRKYFRKSTDRLHSKLENESRCLSVATGLKLPKIQVLVDSNININGVSYIITEFCGINIRRNIVPDDWREQLDIIQSSVDTLKQHKVFHNDIQSRNLFVMGKNLTLIDFDLGTIGQPDRRARSRPGFNNVDYIIDKITNRWRLE